MPFGRLSRIVKNGMGLDEGSTLFFIFSKKDVQDFIIDLNVQGQLYEKGINAEGVELESIGGEYSTLTKWLKSEAGLPFDRVTLFDTGEFYESFTITANKEGLTIESDTNKDGDDLQDRWGTKLMGLTNDSKRQLAEHIAQDIYRHILQQVLR